MAARLIEAYERKAHHFGVFDCLVLGEAGQAFAHIRHTTIFRIAPRTYARRWVTLARRVSARA